MRFQNLSLALSMVTMSAFTSPLFAAPVADAPATAAVPAVVVPTPQQLLASSRVLVIAHRGYSGIAPENTLAAFELAAHTGADMIELDYYHSADDVAIVLHDKTLDRTTNAVARWGKEKITVKDVTAAELATLDAGQWFAPRYAGAKLPTLSESIDLINRDNVTLIERKEGDAASLVKMLNEKQARDKVIVQAFDWDFLRDCHLQAPALVTGALGPPSSRGGVKLETEEKFLSPAYLDEVQKTGARVVGWNSNYITSQSVGEAHRRGLKVWVYTVNDVAKAQSLIAMGVDGIISNETPLIWKAIALSTAK